MRHALAIATLSIVTLTVGCDLAPARGGAYESMPRLTPDPIVEICAGRDDPPCQFMGADLVSVAPDGRVAVADMLGELREFDGDGSYLRAIGRKGAGPGEYRALVAMGYDDDGYLTTLDQAGMRVQRFDTAGVFGDVTHAPMIPGLMGASVSRGRVALFALPGAAAVGDTVMAHVLLVDPATGDTASLPALPEPALATGDGSIFPMLPLFSVMPSDRWGVSDDGALLLADGERMRIMRRESDAEAPRVVVDLAPTPRPITASDLETEKTAQLEVALRMNRNLPPTFRAALDEAANSAPKSYAFVSRLVVLDDGTLMTREDVSPAADSARWNAFTASGEPVGYMLLPADGRVAAGRLERLVVVTHDVDDVPRIVVYRVGGVER